MPGISSLSGTISDSINWSASNNVTAQNPILQGDAVSTSFSFGTANANNAVGGADEIASFLQTIAAGGSATIDLQSLTNILQQSGVALTRLKGYKIRLLAASGKGAVDTVNGTACSSITVGNAASNAHPLEMGASTYTYGIGNGGTHQVLDVSAAGIAVTPSSKNVLITNNDGSVAAAVQVTIIGATT